MLEKSEKCPFGSSSTRGGDYESNCCRFKSKQEVIGRRSRTWDGEHNTHFKKFRTERTVGR